MAQKDQRTSGTSIPNMDLAGFAEAGRKQLETLMDMQKQFFDMEEVNRHWVARAKVEADLANEFSAKLTAAHSMTDVVAACQEWMGRRMELYTEDSRRLITDGQKFMAATAQLFTSGFKGGGR